jgi:serine-type D-Ala-D-Ala carboxypeptidase/endopeptidase (penicillin-binding protein 4)
MKKIKIVGGWRLAVGNWATFPNASKLKTKLLLSNLFIIAVSTSGQQKQINKLVSTILLKDSAISTGHIGISIYEPATNKYWYNYNADKYFIPASNTKLFSLYAGMKYLGDSLVGLRYKESNDSITIYPTADPTLLHTDFPNQPVIKLLSDKKYFNYCSQYFINSFGKGWAWDDYGEEYMVQRNEFPLYGNLISINKIEYGYKTIPHNIDVDIHKSFENYNDSIGFSAYRNLGENKILVLPNYQKFNTRQIVKIPIIAGLYDMPRSLMDTLHNKMSFGCVENYKNTDTRLSIIYSHPSDSLFKPMMHNSDNFFAEQTLLMASNEYLGYMSDEKIIDTILKTGLKDIPQKPKWVDGSGLSRYNLFTPQSFVYLLNKMKNEFGMERLKVILPTGGEGTLSAYYKKDAGFIFAKTGTLSNNCALSGYLITSKGKLLIFSVLVNNYITGATPVRKAVEQFLQTIREKY